MQDLLRDSSGVGNRARVPRTPLGDEASRDDELEELMDEANEAGE